MTLELLLVATSYILELYLLVNGILTSIKSLIGDNSYNAYYTEYEILIKLTVTLVIIFILVLNSIKRNYIIIRYRFRKHPQNFDLSIRDFIGRQSEIITCRFKKSNDKSVWIYFLNKLNFILLIDFKCPFGVTLGREREIELTNRDFKLRTEKVQSLSYTLPLYANGAREISISVSMRDDASFAGNEPIHIKTYIAFNMPIVRNIIKFEIGYDCIDINTSC